MALGNPKWHFFEDYKTIENFGLIKWNSGMGDGVQPKHILIMGGWPRVCFMVTRKMHGSIVPLSEYIHDHTEV